MTSIHPGTAMGAVTLSVAALDRSVEHYTEVVGLEALERGEGAAALGTGGRVLLRLVERPGAVAVPGSPGLYHLALLVPAPPIWPRRWPTSCDTGSGWREPPTTW